MISQESYPGVSPMWFTEDDESSVLESVEKIVEGQRDNGKKNSKSC